MKFPRKKRRNSLLSFFYKFDKILPLSRKRRLKLYLDLEWVFERLAHEHSFRVFDNDDHPVRALSVEFLLRHLKQTDVVLDVGCNKGDLTSRLSPHVKDIVGIDSNAEFIEQARRRYTNPNIHFVIDDAIAYLANNDRKFDVLILSHILEHLEAPDTFLNSCKGYFNYVYIELPDFDRSHLNIYRKALGSSLIYADADHIWEFDRTDLRELIRRNGLVVHDSQFIHGVQKYWCSFLE